MHPELNRTQRRAASARQLATIQRQQLAEQISRIVADQPNRQHQDQCHLLGEDIGQPSQPLWVFLGIQQAALVMSGNAEPVRFTPAEVVELSPLLGLWMGEYQFVPMPHIKHLIHAH